MSKLVVEVVDASDLKPKDGQGSASPFVEVEFDKQIQRTQTKYKDLNPFWNEKLVFNINSFEDLPNKTIEVTVFNNHDQTAAGHITNNFLGRVRISGVSVAASESEASVNRYPLDKFGPFSRVKGDIALKIYADHAGGPPPPSYPNHNETKETSFNDVGNEFTANINDNNLNHNRTYFQEEKEEEEQVVMPEAFHDGEKKPEKGRKKEKEEVRRTFHSIGTAAPPPVMKEKPPSVETRTDFAKAGPGPVGTVMQMQVPRQNPEFMLVETSPPVAARMRYRGIGGDKTDTTYDLVERMHYLYVNVVKARDLPVMDVSGSLDPYVEVKLGNYKGITRHFEKNQHPVWKQIFAFSKERMQSNLLEVTVKDKDVISKDDFVGRVVFDLTEVIHRVPPDGPLAPQWYRLEDRKGIKKKGEIMLAVWMGTQADEAFPEAWHSDAHDIGQINLASTRSKVYFSPKLYYLRVIVIEAQDLLPSEKGRVPDAFVRVSVGNNKRMTRPSPRTHNPIWNDELMFVVSEPLEDLIIVSVEDRFGPGKDEVLGRAIIPLREVPQRLETPKPPNSRWLNLHKPTLEEEAGAEKRRDRFASKINLLLCLEAGYHVLDESTHFSSDLRPSSRHLQKASIGILELGFLSARGLLPMKPGGTTDPYCVAKYGNKWVRTRTLLNTLNPRWNEQYTWEVYDPCTVITIGVFDNRHTNGHRDDERDQRIGKVRIRLSTLETNRVYTHYHPLLVLQPSGLKKNGEIQLALRFICTAWGNMVTKYCKPLLPKMHYAHPISVRHIDMLRHQAMQIVAARLARSEPPLRREIVEYMLDVDYHMFSLRRSKANFHRIMSVLSGVTAVCRWLNDICYWRNPITTCLVHVLFLILVCYPELILPTIFLYLFMIGIWNYRFRPRHPPHMDIKLSQAVNVNPDELDEEFDTFPTTRPPDVLRMRYDRLRVVAGRVQTVVGDLASQGERAQAILNWRDPRATAIFIFFSLMAAVFIYVTPFQLIVVLYGLYLLRHPRLRSKMPSVPVNFFKRLPSKSDMLL